MKSIAIINGPNLNLVGQREPDVYGTQSLDDYLDDLAAKHANVVTLTRFQSNIEGELIDELQRVGRGEQRVDGIVLNAGGYSHTSVAIADAIRAIDAPVVEAHISNVMAREPFRHHSMIGAACKGTISGFGLDSYRLAVCALLLNP